MTASNDGVLVEKTTATTRLASHQLDSIKPQTAAGVNATFDSALSNSLAKELLDELGEQTLKELANDVDGAHVWSSDGMVNVKTLGHSIVVTKFFGKARSKSVSKTKNMGLDEIKAAGEKGVSKIIDALIKDCNQASKANFDSATFDAATGKMVLNLFLQIKDENGNWVDLPDEELEYLRDFPAARDFSDDEFISMAESYGFSKVFIVSRAADRAVRRAQLSNKNDLVFFFDAFSATDPHLTVHADSWYTVNHSEGLDKKNLYPSLRDAMSACSDIEPTGKKLKVEEEVATTRPEFKKLLDSRGYKAVDNGRYVKDNGLTLCLVTTLTDRAGFNVVDASKMIGEFEFEQNAWIDAKIKTDLDAVAVPYGKGLKVLGEKLDYIESVEPQAAGGEVVETIATNEAAQTAPQNEDVAFLQSIIDGKQSEAMASPDFADKLTDMYARVQGVEADLALFNRALQLYTDFVLEATK
jgi:hypothetical protein